MGDEEKDLLLSDLCARLPYKVKVQFSAPPQGDEGVTIKIGELYAIDLKQNLATIECDGINYYVDVYLIKPYLFPLSKLSKKDKTYLKRYLQFDYNRDGSYFLPPVGGCTPMESVFETTGILNARLIDYNNLIYNGLAIDATTEKINPYEDKTNIQS